VTVEAEGESASASATVEADSTTTTEVSVKLVESFSFTAKNTGGFISFNESTIDSAKSEGINFPTEKADGEGIVIKGQAEGGQWESTEVSFPTLSTGTLEAEATAPNGLQGTIDRENNVMTAEGTLKVTIPLNGASFQFNVSLASELSNGNASDTGLQGSADFANNKATLVDNEYTVNDTTESPLVNAQLGLPLTDSGLAWLELPFEFEFSEE
jgi:hypothetical protein